MSVEISVIIPFYNTPHIMLRKAIDHILDQSFKDFELLLVDDGSKNDYTFLIENYKNDKRVKFFKQENSGVSSARNKGIELSVGKYIVFHDADDFVENNYLYSLHKEIEHSDLVICGIAAQWYPSVDSYLGIRQFLSTPSTYNYVQYTNFSVNKIFKKEILENNNIRFHSNIKLGEDALFIANYLRCCKLIRTIPQRLYYYVPHSSSATNNYDSGYWEYEKLVISEQIKLFSSYPLNINESAFLMRWLYLKMRGCLFYYLWHENHFDYRNEKLKDILNSRLMNELFSSKDRAYFTWIDKVIIYLWKSNGVEGVKVSYFMKILSNKFSFLRRLFKI